MAIESNPFGGVKLTGEDAAQFMRQIMQPVSEEQRKRAAETLERGRAMAAELARNGSVLIGRS